MNSVADPQDLDPDPDQCQIIYADPDPILFLNEVLFKVLNENCCYYSNFH